MIEPDHVGEKLAGGGSGPTFCSASSLFQQFFGSDDFIDLALEARQLFGVDSVKQGITAAVIMRDCFGFAVHSHRRCGATLIDNDTGTTVSRFRVRVFKRKISDSLNLRDEFVKLFACDF